MDASLQPLGTEGAPAAAQPVADPRVGCHLLRFYLDEIDRHPLLSEEEERSLGRAIEGGRRAAAALGEYDGTAGGEREMELRGLVAEGERATRGMVLANLRLVVVLAKRYRYSGVPLLDLIQEGNLGLLHAAEKCDYTRHFRFSTYAKWWIRHFITRGIDNTGRMVRLPVHSSAAIEQVRQATAWLEQDLGRSPTVVELSSEVGFPPERVAEILAYRGQPLSTSGWEDEGTVELEDTESASPFDDVVSVLVAEHVTRCLESLLPREREVLRLHYGLDGQAPCTLEEVGRRFGISRERARQIKSAALEKMRKSPLQDSAKALDLITG